MLKVHSSEIDDYTLIARRIFLRGCVAAPILACGGAAYAIGYEPTNVKVNTLPMPLRGLSPSFAGYRLVQISDLHCGGSVPMEYLEGCLDMVNALSPDVVVVTGDILDRGQWSHAAAAARLLCRLEASDGVVAVLGNNDHGVRYPAFNTANSYAAEQISSAVLEAGHQLLRNESLRITRGEAAFRIVGLGDSWARRFDPKTAFKDVDGREPVIALTHNPDTFVALCKSPAQWSLAGHTHGGQVRIPLFGAPITPVHNKAFTSGLFEMCDRHFYVNRGLGWLYRIRMNARPEITLFELESV